VLQRRAPPMLAAPGHARPVGRLGAVVQDGAPPATSRYSTVTWLLIADDEPPTT
jgi:hypothetical protein